MSKNAARGSAKEAKKGLARLPAPISTHVFPTELGFVGLAWSASGVCGVSFPVPSQKLAHETLRKRFLATEPGKKKQPGFVKKLVNRLTKELKGQAVPSITDEIPFDFSQAPPFHQKIYREALKIPRGQTVSYTELAKRAGSPKAARAVGQAMAKNPVPLLVPCHRVLAAGGKIGGFTAPGGLSSKQQLLEMEGCAPSIKLRSKASLESTSQANKKLKPVLLTKSFDAAQALRDLSRQDAKLSRLIKKVGAFTFKPTGKGSPYEWLLRSIIYQQLHGKAAATIHGRLQALFDGRNPTPEQILATDDAKLQSVGLSRNKLLAIKDLAKAASEGRVPDRKQMARMSDEEIIATLVPIRGIGRWTVEMLLIFGLGRTDVLAVDDFALRKSAMLLHGLIELDRKGFQKLGEKWRPWRSVASWYLWRALD